MTGRIIIGIGLVGALAACRPAEPPPVEAPAAVEAAPPAPEARLGDAEVAHIVVTANAIDVETGELALERSENAEVRAFAQRMITEHRAVNEAAEQLVTRLGVTPAGNDVSQSLRSDAQATRARLAGLSGAEFDRAYIDHEIAYHAAVLAAIDDLLIPSADHPELRSTIEGVRPAIESHLEHARSLRDQVR